MSTDAKSRIVRLLALRQTPQPRPTWMQLAVMACATCAVVAGVALAQPRAAKSDNHTLKTQSTVVSEIDDARNRDSENQKVELNHVIEPLDIVKIEAVRMIPKAPYRIQKVDVLQVDVDGESPRQPIDNMLFVVEPGGELNLGAAYGKVRVVGLSLDEARDAVEGHLSRKLKGLHVSLDLIESSSALQIVGLHTIGPDGYLNLGAFGHVPVAGMTIRDARKAVEVKLSERFEKPSISIAAKSVARLEDAREQDDFPATPTVYRLEPPDILRIEPIRLLPKGPQRVEKLDQLEIEVSGTQPEAPIEGIYKVDADGELNLGPEYGRVQVAGLTVKETIQRIDEFLRKTLRNPQVAVSMAEKWKVQAVGGTHLIAPDGYINLGVFGQVFVTGMTLSEAREAIEKKLSEYFEKSTVAVEVMAFNSKVYYVITQGGGSGDNIVRLPITGNETVLDALAHANAAIRKDMKIWIARPSGNESRIITVDWAKLTSGEDNVRKYRILPGDRIFLSDGGAKRTSDVQRHPGVPPTRRW